MSIFTERDNVKHRCITKAIAKRNHAFTLKLRKIICIRDAMQKLVHLCRCKLRPWQRMKHPLNLKNGGGTGIHVKRLSPLADYKLHQVWHRV